MEILTIGKTKINLNFETQVSTLGREFRLSGTRKNGQMPDKWVNGSYKSHWIYTFIYLDDKKTFELEFDYYDKFYRKL